MSKSSIDISLKNIYSLISACFSYLHTVVQQLSRLQSGSFRKCGANWSWYRHDGETADDHPSTAVRRKRNRRCSRTMCCSKWNTVYS